MNVTNGLERIRGKTKVNWYTTTNISIDSEFGAPTHRVPSEEMANESINHPPLGAALENGRFGTVRSEMEESTRNPRCFGDNPKTFVGTRTVIVAVLLAMVS